MPFLPNAEPNIQDAVAVTSWNTVASFAHYSDARDAVDRLVLEDFPVGELEIVGTDLRTVERVTGKMTSERAALSGAAAGAWTDCSSDCWSGSSRRDRPGSVSS